MYHDSSENEDDHEYEREAAQDPCGRDRCRLHEDSDRLLEPKFSASGRGGRLSVAGRDKRWVFTSYVNGWAPASFSNFTGSNSTGNAPRPGVPAAVNLFEMRSSNCCSTEVNS